jgi:hypothetical protein
MLPYPELSKKLRHSGNKVKATSKKSNQDLWIAYELVGKLLENLMGLGIETSGKTASSISARISLSANMVQAFYVVEQLISEGAYWSAAAVLRQHMETLARIVGYRTGISGKAKKPENAVVLPFGLNRNYGRLSQLCHTSDGEILEDFSECAGMEGSATVAPEFREKWARFFFFIHIEHMFHLAVEIYLLQMGIDPSRNLVFIENDFEEIAGLLVKSGLWEERVVKRVVA